jgi:hypothetical protein
MVTVSMIAMLAAIAGCSVTTQQINYRLSER